MCKGIQGCIGVGHDIQDYIERAFIGMCRGIMGWIRVCKDI